MINVKNVSEALLCCANRDGCWSGHYVPTCSYASEFGCDVNQIMLDAYELLKEQKSTKASAAEPIKLVRTQYIDYVCSVFS